MRCGPCLELGDDPKKNELASNRRHASRVHFASNSFGPIHCVFDTSTSFSCIHQLDSCDSYSPCINIKLMVGKQQLEAVYRAAKNGIHDWCPAITFLLVDGGQVLVTGQWSSLKDNFE